MQEDDIMKTTAAVLAQQLPLFCESKDIPRNTRILVDAFCIKSGQPLIESRFDYRAGQGGDVPFRKLRDFERPSMWAAPESNINSLVNRDAWPGDMKNANTILVILTNSREAIDDATLKKINENASKMGSRVIQIKNPDIPRPEKGTTLEGRRILLNKTIAKLLEGIKSELKSQQNPPPPPPPPPLPPPPKPTAKFKADPLSGPSPLMVRITNTSSNANKFEWDFGNGEKSTERNPASVTYPTAGDYTITLKASGESSQTNSASTIISVTRPEPPPKPATADFSATPESGDSPLTVKFTDKSSNAASLNWDFGDKSTSAERFPSHEFKTPGVYSVKLKAVGADGKVSEATKNITVKAPPPIPQPIPEVSASFRADPDTGNAPLKVQFNNTSENAISYKWNFGDGATSEEKSPSHSFNKAGNYKVKLVATGEAGSDTASKEIKVQKGASNLPLFIAIGLAVLALVAFFLYGILFPPKMLQVKFKRNGLDAENSPQSFKKAISLSQVFGAERNMKVFIFEDKEIGETKIQFLLLDDRPTILQNALDPSRTIALQRDIMSESYKLGEYRILDTNESFEVSEPE